MNIEETRRNEAARCRVDLRQMFDKGLYRLKFGGCIRHTKENDAIYLTENKYSVIIFQEMRQRTSWTALTSGVNYSAIG